MEFGEIIGYVISAVGGGGLMSIINWRLNKKKAAVEVKVDEIQALHDTIEMVYKPVIDQLQNRVKELDDEVKSLREQLARERADHQTEIDLMNKRILAITSALGMKAVNQLRGSDGRFAKACEPEDEQ